ncbi:MAG: valine--tRNA ligase, partial [Candidatus Uhrbacteria bacterium]
MDKLDIPKAYEAKKVEDKIYSAWEKSGLFNPDNIDGEPFTIMMPPPNVTGILHLGHALENSMMDTMIRYQRLKGRKTLLLPGTDHAAIATQAKVEKILMDEGIENPRQELGREKLVEKIREFAEDSKETILSQIKKLGTSCDWSRLAYTFDEDRNTSVKELFVRMYNDGLIYRGYRVVNWSVKGQSTSSDDEIVHVERTAKLYTFKYSKDFPITIATTRPETKLGDTAVAVHPKDKRYKEYIGQVFTVDVGAAKPLEIKIISNEEVDPDFGTGALGVTPAHAQADFAMYENQKAKQDPIGIIQVIGKDGKMTEEAGDYAGLGVEEAREKFVAWLDEQGLLEKEEEITQNVGTSDRYGDLIEAIPMTQWWLDMNKTIPSQNKSLRDLMRETVTTGLNGQEFQKVTITPERFTKLYIDRVDNLRDWCLSRQLWWGHRIPVWYKGEEIYVGTEAPKEDGWEQDPDTLDTWFSSGSWTFSTLGWPGETEDLKSFHPTTWMQMGYEILYLWLMRMVLMSTYALQQIPFKDVYIHGMLRDQHGQKFSKSAGNGIDPIEVIETYGADALRISLLLGVSPGNDSRYYTEKIESGRNFTNKLWNISRFVLTSVAKVERVSGVSGVTLADKWILSRFSQ